MKSKNKNKLQPVKEIIDSLQKQIKKLMNLSPQLEKKQKELNKFESNLENQVDSRTSAERVIHKQLRSDIERCKHLEQVAKDAFEYANGIINTVREPLIVLDVDLKVVSASRAFYKAFKVKPESTEKQYIYDLGNNQWNIPKLRELLEDILPNTTSFDNFEVEHTFPDIGKRTMLLNARKIYRKTNHTRLVLLAIEDITERKIIDEKLKNLASHDELTGCLNFRSLMQALESEISRSQRYKKKFSVIMIDVDQLKRINDEFGHLVGNEALVAFADVIKNSVRNIDIVGRFGGDELMIALPESDSQQALVVLERIRNDFSQTKIISAHKEDAKDIALKFSAGIVVFPDNAKNLKELIWVADNALRQAKREGKNRAVLERRELIRFSPLPGTKIEMIDSSNKENVKAIQIANISKKGMLLLSAQDIFDEELLCRISCPKGESPFKFTCKVKHKGKAEGELYRIGVYFPEMPESIKEKLSNCIESPKESD